MRLRAALLTAGIAAMTVSALSAPAQAAASPIFIGVYPTKSKCVDVGQQYVREGFSSYGCLPVYIGATRHELWIR